MSFVEVRKTDGIAFLTLKRGKVNAVNPELVRDLKSSLESLEGDTQAEAVVLTGAGKFFSFGLDVPEFLSYRTAQFTDFLVSFTELNTYLFLYPKPVVAALNGHTMAGGCMLALACDARLMVSGKPRIALNEITFGSSVFAGSTEMLRYWVGGGNATKILLSGAMYGPDEAKSMGLVDEIVDEKELLDRAAAVASVMAAKNPPTFSAVKSLLRGSIMYDVQGRERESIRRFVEIWYSDAVWANLKKIEIR